MAYAQFRGRDRHQQNIGVSDQILRKRDIFPVIASSLDCAIGSSGTMVSTAGTGWKSTAGTNGTASTFYFAGTVELALGSAGTVKTDSTYGTAREIYFCNTAGTTKAVPTGITPFGHYYISTRGYSSTSFTFGTSPTGTAGTQVNCTGTSGTHMLWVKWEP